MQIYTRATNLDVTSLKIELYVTIYFIRYGIRILGPQMLTALFK